MAALAILNGANLNLGIRQATVDLPKEPINFFNYFFMDAYLYYMHQFREISTNLDLDFLQNKLFFCYRDFFFKLFVINEFSQEEIIQGACFASSIPIVTTLKFLHMKNRIVWDCGMTSFWPKNENFNIYASPFFFTDRNANVNICGNVF